MPSLPKTSITLISSAQAVDTATVAATDKGSVVAVVGVALDRRSATATSSTAKWK